MNHRLRPLALVFSALWGAANSATGAIDPAHFAIELTDLGAGVIPTAINNVGQVAGRDYNSGQAFRWESGALTLLGTLGGAESFANDLNDAGTVVGWSHDSAGKRKSFKWSGSMTNLDSMVVFEGAAEAINNHDVIVGWRTTGNNWGSVWWDQYTPEGEYIFGGESLKALGINDHSEIVGIGFNINGVADGGFYWDGRGVPAQYTSGLGQNYLPIAGINDNGVTGGARGRGNAYFQVGIGQPDAAGYPELLDSDGFSRFLGLSNFDLLVGESDHKGFLLDLPNRELWDLNSFQRLTGPAGNILRLTDINDNNEFSGVALVDGVGHGITGRFVADVSTAVLPLRFETVGVEAPTRFDSLTGMGVSGASYRLDDNPTAVNDAGQAVAELSFSRSYRWGASETTELSMAAADINSAGVVVGWRMGHAVRWDDHGGLVQLGNLGARADEYFQSNANAVNDSGVAVGTAEKYVDGVLIREVPVRWNPAGVASELPATSRGAAIAISNSGFIAGSVDKGDVVVGGNAIERRTAVRWDAMGNATELANLESDPAGPNFASPYDVNDAGTIVGFARDTGPQFQRLGTRAVRWDAGGSAITELGHLGLDSTGSTFARARAVNDTGDAVGEATKFVGGVDLGVRAVRWQAGETAAIELGTLGTDRDGHTETSAFAINSGGIVVGYADRYDQYGTSLGRRAVLWSSDNVAFDLNSWLPPDSGWTFLEALAISDTGWVSGRGTFDPDGPRGRDDYLRMFTIQIPLVPALAGDYDRDGDVDGGDFLMWQRQLGAASLPYAGADGNGSGAVDDADLTVWRDHFGTGPTATGVPEPDSFLLLLAVPGTALGLRRRTAK